MVLTPWGIGSLPGTSRACLCLPLPGGPLDRMCPEGRLPLHLFTATCGPQYPPAPGGRSQWETVQGTSSGAESESWQVTVTTWRVAWILHVNVVKHCVGPVLALPSSHFNTSFFYESACFLLKSNMCLRSRINKQP